MPESRPPEEFPPADDPFVVVTMDPNGTITTWNPGAETVCGWSAAEAVGQPGAIIFTDEDRAAGVPEREIATALREGEAIDERWHRRQNGTTFWASGVMSALRTVDGALLGFIKVFRDLTRQKAAEGALRESEGRYRALFTSMTEGFALCEVILGDDGQAPDYRLLDINPAYGQVTGLTREQVVGRTAREIVPSTEVEGFIKTYGRVFADHAPARFESKIEGLGRWLDTYAFPLDPAGDGRFGVVLSDVTARKQTEVALRASAARATFRAALADALRPLTAPLEVKAVATRLLGLHLGASRVHYGEVDEEAFVVVDRDYTAGSPSLTGRFRMESFNPALAWAHDAGQNVVTADIASDAGISESDRAAYASVGVAAQVCVPLVKGGHLAAVLAVHQREPREWTAEEVALVEETAERTWTAVARARAEAALRGSEAQFRALTNATSDVMYRMGPDWTEMRQLVGGGFLADTVGTRRDWREGYLHPDDRALVDAAIAEAVRSKGVFELEHRVLREDGTVGWTFSRAVPLLNEHGEVTEWFGAASDVTERRRAEAEVHALNETLEARVEERTREVRALAARLTLAEQAERERIAFVLHDDLQQQHHGLSMLLTVARDAPDESAALLGRALQILDSAVRTTRTLVTEMNPTVLQTDRLADLLRWIAAETTTGLNVQVEVRGDIRVAHPALRIVLFQSVREALLNVAKHASVLRARLVAWEGDGEVVVRVEDDGAGFDVARALSSASNGLGLFSGRERLGHVGGRFEIDSAPGRGTRVTLAVPSPDSP